jgi:hypothetical protein
MIELIQFPWSPYCIVQRRILEYSGARFKITNIPTGDRSRGWRLTRQRYYQVPVIRDGRNVVFELNEDLDAIRAARAAGAPEAETRAHLEAVRRPIDGHVARFERRLEDLTARWDALVERGAPAAERRPALDQMKTLLLERSYINNLLAALIDNHIYYGLDPRIDPRRVAWRRGLDMNDRALRSIVSSLGGVANGFAREDGFDITVASEVMAIFCLVESVTELRERLGIPHAPVRLFLKGRKNRPQ